MSNRKEVIQAKITVLKAERELIEKRDYAAAAKERAAAFSIRAQTLEAKAQEQLGLAKKHDANKQKKLDEISVEIQHYESQLKQEVEG